MNDKEQAEFERLQKELGQYKNVLSKASDIIREKEVSNYPIFVFHQHEMELGVPIVEKEKAQGKWNIQASSMEEFVSKSLIQAEKIEDFKKVYKDPDTHFCIFIISGLGAQFVFLEQ